MASLLLFVVVTLLDYRDSRHRVEERAQGLARVLAQNLRAPLSFTDPTAADRVLEGLGAVPEVRWAAVLDDHSALFARYAAKGAVVPGAGAAAAADDPAERPGSAGPHGGAHPGRWGGRGPAGDLHRRFPRVQRRAGPGGAGAVRGGGHRSAGQCGGGQGAGQHGPAHRRPGRRDARSLAHARLHDPRQHPTAATRSARCTTGSTCCWANWRRATPCCSGSRPACSRWRTSTP